MGEIAEERLGKVGISFDERIKSLIHLPVWDPTQENIQIALILDILPNF